MNRNKRIILMGVTLVAIIGTIVSCTHDPYVLPENLRKGDPNICFDRDILPIFQSACVRGGCHDAGSHKAGYTLDSYDNIVKNGIVPGNAAASVIWQSIQQGIFGVKAMPEDAPRLPQQSIDLIKRWINTGAVNGGVSCGTSTCDSNNFTYSGAVAPIMQTYCVGCHYSSSVAGGSLTDYNSVREATINGRLIGDIKHLAGYNPMPQGSAKLEDCKIRQIEKWAESGAPNN